MSQKGPFPAEIRLLRANRSSFKTSLNTTIKIWRKTFMNEWFDKYFCCCYSWGQTFCQKCFKKKASKDWVDFSRFFLTSSWLFMNESFGKKKSKSLKSLSSISRVKESVRNASQKKNEFLRKLQEIEQISVSKKV